MSTKERLTKRFWNTPADFTMDELVRLMAIYGYYLDNKGKTSGSAIIFRNPTTCARVGIHKPHPGNIVKRYALRIIQQHLREAGIHE